MRKKKRALPMPTEEEKQRAKLKAAGSDPLVWAMKVVDDEFSDGQEKDPDDIDEDELTTEARVDRADEVDDELVESKNNVVSNEDVMDELDEIEEMEEESRSAEIKKVEKTTKTQETKTLADDNKEIKAEGKTTVPMGNGALTIEVTPMRQDVTDVSPEEVTRSKENLSTEESTNKVAEKKRGFRVKKIEKIIKKDSSVTSDDPKVQVKLTSLESKQKKMMVAIVVLVLLAVGGILFGVTAVVRQGKTAEELENQIANNTVSTESEGVDGDYIYLKDWGLKIKIITGLTNVSYNYMTDDYTEVLIWGSTKNKDINFAPDFAKQTKNSTPLGSVVRVPRYERAAAGRLIWYDDYYNFYYQGPSGVPEVSEDEMSWWVESYLLIKEMLTNADNYSSIGDATVGQQ